MRREVKQLLDEGLSSKKKAEKVQDFAEWFLTLNNKDKQLILTHLFTITADEEILNALNNVDFMDAVEFKIKLI